MLYGNQTVDDSLQVGKKEIGYENQWVPSTFWLPTFFLRNVGYKFAIASYVSFLLTARGKLAILLKSELRDIISQSKIVRIVR